jgi:hypothetical protein
MQQNTVTTDTEYNENTPSNEQGIIIVRTSIEKCLYGQYLIGYDSNGKGYLLESSFGMTEIK